MLNKVLFIASIIASVFLVVLLFFTTPSGVGPIGVLVFFTLCYVICLGIIVALCNIFFGLRGQINNKHQANASKKSYYYGAVLAFAPVIVLAIRSFGRIGALEVGLVFFAVIVACFLVSKRIL